MKTVNELIAEENFTEAAEVVYQALLYLINNYVPNIELTKEEWDLVAPSVVAKMEEPTTEEEEDEDTEEPGDDVEIVPTKADLVVTFEGEGVTLPPTYKRTYVIGRKYNYIPPKIDGYTASPEQLTGTMTAEGVEETITYTADTPTESEEELEPQG